MFYHPGEEQLQQKGWILPYQLEQLYLLEKKEMSRKRC